MNRTLVNTISTTAGEGGVNYTTNSNFNDNIDNWFVSTGDGYLEQETTNQIEDDGSLKIVNDFSTTRFVVDGYIDTIDDIDIGVLLGIEATIDTPSTTTDGYYTYELYNNTDSQTVSGTSTDLKPGRNYIRGSFVPESGKEYYHRIKDISGANADELVIDRVKITPDRAGTGQPERIAVRYTTSAGQLFANVTFEIINFDTKVYDDGSSSDNVATGSSWVFTAPRVGKYLVEASVLFDTTTTWAENEYVDLHIRKNGSDAKVNRTIGTDTSGASGFKGASISGVIEASTGDTIAVGLTQNSGGNLGLNANGNYNQVSITEVSTPAPINRFDRGVTTSNQRLLAKDASGTTLGTSLSDIEWSTVTKGSLVSSKEYEIEQDGDYEVESIVRATDLDDIRLHLDTGSGYSLLAIGTPGNASGVVSWKDSFNKGDKLKVQASVSTGTPTASSLSYLSVVRIADHSAIAPVGFATSDEADTSERYLLPLIQESGQGDTGTVSWLGTDPSGTTTSKYRWIRNGNVVDLWWRWTATVAGSTTSGSWDLPSSVPTPDADFMGASDNEFTGYNGSAGYADAANGGFSNASNTDRGTGHCAIYRSGSTYTLFVQSDTTSTGAYVQAHIRYYTND